VVADIFDSIRADGILHPDPNLLVKQEQVQIVQHRCDGKFAHCVISSTDEQKRIVNWQVAHSVTVPGAWRLATCFDAYELSMDHFVVYNHGFEIPKLVGNKGAILKPTTEVINSFFDLVTL